MKQLNLILIATLLLSLQGIGQCPPNLDFEKGDYSGWSYSVGDVKVENNLNKMILTSSQRIPGRHNLIDRSNAGLDPYGKFPTLCPYGGNYSMKLGNAATGAEAEAISYTFTVPAVVDTFTFTFFYAVVFEDPQHSIEQQPRFFATAYDVLTGNLINCASYDFVSTSGIPGFEVSPVNSNVLYKNWSPVSIQFAGLANRQVRLEFKTADCTLGGHFGYAYVDVGTECSNILATAPYCVETNSVILNAPYGFASYTWYNNDFSAVLGTGQSLTLSPPPIVNDVFHVDMIPYPGFGCRDTTYAIVHPEPVPDTPVANSFYHYCQSVASSALTAQAQPGLLLLWYTSETGGVGSETAPVPPTNVTGTFTYFVSQKKLFGCESPRKKITVVVTSTPLASFTVNSVKQCQVGNQFLFTSTSTNLENSTYTWDLGIAQPTAAGTDTDTTFSYPSAGRFDVKLKVVNAGLCYSETSATVTVVPKPVAAFSYPQSICEQQTQVTMIDNSTVQQGLSAINNWWWDIGGTVHQIQRPAPFTFNAAGPVKIRLAVTTQEGCISDTTTHNVMVHYRPVARFDFSPLCENQFVQFNNLSFMPPGSSPEMITKWDWQFSDGSRLNSQHPRQAFSTGVHDAKLIVESDFGCRSLQADSLFTIHAKPEIAININDSCVNIPIRYSTVDLTNSVTRWHWNFGNGLSEGSSSITKTFTKAGPNSFTLIGETAHGCTDTLFRSFTIYENNSFAGNDTLAAMDQPVQLNANGGPSIQYTWSPSTGLSDPHLENPVATLDRDQRYQLYTISDKGCIKNSDIFIKRYKGPALYIPSAFTPNNDGKNDIFFVTPVGLKKFISLTIYNRHGQIVFHTEDHTKGWDGTLKKMPQSSDNYVVVVRAIDYAGKPLLEKGNLVLIR